MSVRASLLLSLLTVLVCWCTPALGQEADPPCRITPDDPDGDCIIGEARIDYPTLLTRPPTSFNCDDYLYPGLYADVEADCQLFHYCPPRSPRPAGHAQDRPAAFLCTRGSLFNQQYGVCDHWFNVVCERAPVYYANNKLLYQTDVTDNELTDSDA